MKKKRGAKKAAAPAARESRLAGWLLVAVLVTLPAVVMVPWAKDAFRLPKLLVSEILGLATLLLLSLRLRAVGRIEPHRLWRHPAVAALVPIAAVAALGLAFTDHPHHVAQALPSLFVAVACTIGWSLGLRSTEQRRALTVLALPAVVLALVAIGQTHGLIEPFQFRGVVKERIAITSLAGGAFDLAAYLVLPMLVMQVRLVGGLADGEAERRQGQWRWAWGGALAVCAYALALTQTLSAFLALVVASLVLWLHLVSRRRLAAALALVATVALVLALAVTPLRQRLAGKLGSLRAEQVNHLLSGRLDGWRAGTWMWREHPLLGVGHGAYRAEYGTAKLALVAEGTNFYRRQQQPYFANAHSELVEAAAEWGLVGLMALAWALFVLARQLRAPAEPLGERALLRAAVVSLGVLALTNFPLRLALVAYPYLLVLSRVFALSPREATE